MSQRLEDLQAAIEHALERANDNCRQSADPTLLCACCTGTMSLLKAAVAASR